MLFLRFYDDKSNALAQTWKLKHSNKVLPQTKTKMLSKACPPENLIRESQISQQILLCLQAKMDLGINF